MGAPTPRQLTHTLAATAAAVVMLTGCSSPSPAAPSAPSTTTGVPSTSVPATSALAAAKEQALAAYRGMWRAFVEAATTSDWQAPALGEHATGVALTNLTRALYADHYNGLVTKGQPTLHPTVTSIKPLADPVKAVITDCGDSSEWLKYHEDTGRLADNEPGGRRRINAIVERQDDGSWQVSDFGVHEVGSCV